MKKAVGTEYITTLKNKKNSTAQQAHNAQITHVEMKHGCLVVMSWEHDTALSLCRLRNMQTTWNVQCTIQPRLSSKCTLPTVIKCATSSVCHQRSIITAAATTVCASNASDSRVTYIQWVRSTSAKTKGLD